MALKKNLGELTDDELDARIAELQGKGAEENTPAPEPSPEPVDVGKLSDEEYREITAHADRGAKLLSGLTAFRDIVPWVRSHHERYDGTGYPRGIEGETIPLCARIMTVADVFDALMSKRQYKDSFSLEKAVEIMKEGSGTMFDPEIIECFLAALPKICAI